MKRAGKYRQPANEIHESPRKLTLWISRALSRLSEFVMQKKSEMRRHLEPNPVHMARFPHDNYLLSSDERPLSSLSKPIFMPLQFTNRLKTNIRCSWKLIKDFFSLLHNIWSTGYGTHVPIPFFASNIFRWWRGRRQSSCVVNEDFMDAAH